MALTSGEPIILTLILCLAGLGVASDGCGSLPYFLNVDNTQAVEKSQIVLYGQDITPKVNCSTIPEYCPRRQIEFQVHCILKNVPNRVIPPRITIGRDREILDPQCHGTYFAYGSREKLIVLVRWVNDTWLWDEIVPKYRAAFTGSQDWLEWLAGVCGIEPPRPPAGVLPDQCPSIKRELQGKCKTVCPRAWAKVEDKCVWMGTKAVPRETAREMCVSMGGSLASLAFSSTWSALRAQLPPGSGSWWTSGQCYTQNDTCIWTSLDGMYIDMTRWKDQSSAKNGPVVVDSLGWWTANSTETHNTLCEMYAEPAIEVQLHGSAMVLKNVCCRQPQLSEKTIRIRNHGRTNKVSAHVMSDVPEVTIRAANASDHASRKDTLYALLLADATFSNHAFVYWLVVNIPMTSSGADVSRGVTWLPYIGPKPNTLEGRTVTFIVYKQTVQLEESMKTGQLDLVSADGCSPALRCDFNLDLLTKRPNRTRGGLLFGLERVTSLQLTVTVDAYAIKDLVGPNGYKSGPVCRKVWPQTETIADWAVCPPPDIVPATASRWQQVTASGLVLGVVALKVICDVLLVEHL